MIWKVQRTRCPLRVGSGRAAEVEVVCFRPKAAMVQLSASEVRLAQSHLASHSTVVTLETYPVDAKLQPNAAVTTISTRQSWFASAA